MPLGRLLLGTWTWNSSGTESDCLCQHRTRSPQCTRGKPQYWMHPSRGCMYQPRKALQQACQLDTTCPVRKVMDPWYLPSRSSLEGMHHHRWESFALQWPLEMSPRGRACSGTEGHRQRALVRESRSFVPNGLNSYSPIGLHSYCTRHNWLGWQSNGRQEPAVHT
jgi:hypothetical protein